MELLSPTSAPSTATQSPPSKTTASALTSDFETFLTLLTAQLRNQDPLNPQDSTEFVSQLASFSAVEQQIRTNETLDELLSQSSATQFSDLANLVGQEVSVTGLVTFDGDPVRVDHTVSPTANTPRMLVQSAAGSTVATIPLLPGAPVPAWDGTTDAGSLAPVGPYTFSLAQVGLEGEVIVTPLPALTRVSAIEVDGDQVQLRDPSGTRFAPNAITAVHAPEPSPPTESETPI